MIFKNIKLLKIFLQNSNCMPMLTILTIYYKVMCVILEQHLN